jgi:hypothetical protein
LFIEDTDMEKKRFERKFAGRIFLCAVIITSSIAFGNQSDSQTDNSSMYELKLEGENIEKLILQGGNQKHTFDKPGKSIMLEPGTYHVSELHLQGGFAYFVSQGPARPEPIKVGPGEPAILKAGGPLEQRITAQRKNQLLSMNYSLIGTAGERYRFESMHRPTFTIYKGDKEIASDKFRFG